jgi:heparan-alpha-glucosaminide N-acetyltransferase
MNPAPIRNQAVDAYRGFVMLLMMAEVLHLPQVARAFPDSWLWQTLAYHQSHVAWEGCSLHDMIQPSFSFLVGVALPYSIASRMAKGAAIGPLFGHACWRALVLIALGIFLRSTHSQQTNFTFEDTLTQIGMGYPFLFLLGLRPPRWQWIALGAILTGYWLVWALYPVAPELGFGGHWMKADNYGAAFDRWFLNLFPRATPFEANRGGYLTLSFIPTLGTMILGLAAGRWLRESAPELPLRKFLVAAAAGIAAGLVLHFAGVCPIVKRIWTPSWTLFSGGLCFLFLAGFSWVIDGKGHRRWAFPLVVIGMNSIAAYLIAHLWDRFLLDSFRIHLGADFFNFTGPAMAPFWSGAAVLAIFYWVLLWMYRRKLFLKI